jgi:hypothetical protein
MWSRAAFAAAMAASLATAAETWPGAPPAPTIYPRPPGTLNAPAIVVGRPTEVLYGVAGFAIDEATVPLVCIGALEGDDVVDALIAFCRTVVDVDPQVSGTVQIATAPREQSWRGVRIGGADLLAADLVLTVQM